METMMLRESYIAMIIQINSFPATESFFLCCKVIYMSNENREKGQISSR